MNKKQVRKTFRKKVFERDKYHCRTCGKPGQDRQNPELHKKFHNKPQTELDAHHIQDRTDDNYVRDNGISVCEECHLKAEKFHITHGKEWEPGFHPNDLYRLIGSNWRI